METAREILGLALITKYRRLVEPTDTEILKKYYPECEVILVEVDVDEDDDESQNDADDSAASNVLSY